MRAAAALALALLLQACIERAPRGVARRQAAIDELTAACVEAMVRSTCQVMAGNTPGLAASTVFVAGVGPVDASAYRALRASGDAMCAAVRQSCAVDWEAPACRTARALWPAVPASAPQR